MVRRATCSFPTMDLSYRYSMAVSLTGGFCFAMSIHSGGTQEEGAGSYENYVWTFRFQSDSL